MFTACQPSKKILSIEVDETTIADAFDVATFDVSQIYLIITYEDEETERDISFVHHDKSRRQGKVARARNAYHNGYIQAKNDHLYLNA